MLSHSGALSAKCVMRPYEGADGKQHSFTIVFDLATLAAFGSLASSLIARATLAERLITAMLIGQSGLIYVEPSGSLTSPPLPQRRAIP